MDADGPLNGKLGPGLGEDLFALLLNQGVVGLVLEGLHRAPLVGLADAALERDDGAHAVVLQPLGQGGAIDRLVGE